MALVLLLVAVPGAVAAAPAKTGSAAPRIRLLSGDADKVTGGNALVEVAVHNAAAGAKLRVWRDGTDVTAAFREVSPGRFLGVVAGLVEGEDTIVARTNAGEGVPPGQSALVRITNHPISGPVFSGPHQQPFFCQTETAGLGPALDDDCYAPAQVVYRYRTTTNTFAVLANPADRPADLANVTVDGVEMPYIVRLERGVINRGLYEVAALYDGADPSPFREERGWNGKLVLTFGGGGNVGYRQGDATAGVLVHDALSRGFAVGSNSLMVGEVNFSFPRAAEAAMMTKEHIIERYGAVKHTIGLGGSIGAATQYAIVHAYPGILDGILPTLSFPDPVTNAMGQDCWLLVRYLNTPEGAALTSAQRASIAGLPTFTLCEVLGIATAARFTFCYPIVPIELRYDPATNPTGLRCSALDALGPQLGTDPITGFVPTFFDNDGVQYGLASLNAGDITVEQFLHLNEHIGGFDADSAPQDVRSHAGADVIARLHATGLVTTTLGRGGQAYTPVIDLRRNTDHIFDFHPSFWSIAAHERLVRDGVGPAIHARWIWAPNDTRPHVGEAIDAMDLWLDAIAADTAPGSRADKAIRNRPVAAADGCWPNAAEPKNVSLADCYATAFPPVQDPRMVAGGPVTADVNWCHKKAVDPADYAVAFTPEQVSRFLATFPDGVCDYTKPSRDTVPFAGIWQFYG